MSPPINIDGSEIQKATIDGQNVSEITIDGQQTAGFVDIPDSIADQNEWLHNEGSGATLTDSQGSLDGTISGATWQSDAGRGGHYLLYDGTDDKTDLGAASRSDLSHFIRDGEGAIGMWLNVDSAASGFLNIFGTSGVTSDDGFIIRLDDDGALRFRAQADGNGLWNFVVSNVKSSIEGVWTPIIVDADGSTARIFVDGTPADQSTSINTGNLASTDFDDNVHFGTSIGQGDVAHFDGDIDDAWVSRNAANNTADYDEWINQTEDVH